MPPRLSRSHAAWDIPRLTHPPAAPINGSRRLYQLFKNAVFLSLIRPQRDVECGEAQARLFTTLSEAGMREAQRIFLHILSYHRKGIPDPRVLVLEAMDYCHSGGGTDRITPSPGQHPLDGLFSGHFDHVTTEDRDKKLGELYRNRLLMLQASLAFVVIFRGFLQGPEFFVRGIGLEGISGTLP